MHANRFLPSIYAPQWDTTDAAIQVPSVDNPDLPKGLPLKAGVGLNLAVHVRPLPGISSFQIVNLPVNSTSFFQFLSPLFANAVSC